MTGTILLFKCQARDRPVTKQRTVKEAEETTWDAGRSPSACFAVDARTKQRAPSQYPSFVGAQSINAIVSMVPILQPP